jgi:site-specific recombinase XerC
VGDIMGIRHDLARSIYQVLKFNRDGSYATQDDRMQILSKFGSDLVSLGYGLRDIRGLKEKHIRAVVKHWQTKGLSIPTIKNRMSVLRHLSVRINKANIIPTNDALQIGKRTYIPKTNRALHNPDFSKISNEYIRISLELQRVFGLRREESIKIQPWRADKKDELHLKDSWCKGGRGRYIPILTAEQRFWLDQAKKLVQYKDLSLIPVNKSYIQQRHVYDKQTARAGLKNLHGLRHAYAQWRYKELTGWEAPINGGPKQSQLKAFSKKIDYQTRMILTNELGHGRIQIVKVYCG